ncbi:MAG: single-stranded-DNA-specific exonuclease RecJ [Kiloniellales bacterium]
MPRKAFLGVERSLSGQRWEERLAEPRLALALAQRHGLPELVARILAGRGVALDAAEAFLEPRLRALLPDPLGLAGMAEAVARLLRAVEGGEKIVVFGDYDVDGATSAALLLRFLRAAGVEAGFYIPDREREGYGPNAPALLKLKQQGAGVVVTVDCGITAFEPLAAARAAGLDVIVVDHHVAEPELPAAVAVINPNRLDQAPLPGDADLRLGQLAAVGVCFLVAVALNRALREAGWYATRAEPDLLQLLDLVALGTICDVVPLSGLNRALVSQGLKVLAARGNIGLAALADAARLGEPPEAYHAGFLLGPRINAGGRLGAADLGTRLLIESDPAEAARFAAQLSRLNEERRAIEQGVQEAAIAAFEAGQAAQGLAFAAGIGWHPGVIGIVAGRLRERSGLPALVIALDEQGTGKGSGRSVPGVDLGAAVIAARQAGLLINGGGHPMAAGLTVARDKLDALRDFLDRRLAARIAEIAYRPALGFDGALDPRAAEPALLESIERCGPFGSGNPAPRFALPATRIARADVVGANHVRCILGGAGGGRLKAIAFRAMDSALGPALLQSAGLPYHLAGKLKRDRWNGREGVQFIIEDAARPTG